MWAFFEQDTCWKIKLKGQRNVLPWLIQTSQPWQPSLAGVPGPQWVEASEKILLALEAAEKNYLKEKFISSPLLHIQLVRLPGQVQGEDLGQGIQNSIPSHLDCDGCASHEENDNWRNDENENEDRHSQPLLLICRIQLIPHNLADSPLEWSSF